MMNFVGPSRDDPAPCTTSQKVFGAGVFVAALFATGTVLLAVSESISTADTSLHLESTLPGVALVIGGLVACSYVLTLIHW